MATWLEKKAEVRSKNFPVLKNNGDRAFLPSLMVVFPPEVIQKKDC
jgi:hypothetical protein